MSEAALGLRRPRQEDAQPTRARELDAREPERRLADPGVALQHERGSPTLPPADEGLDRGASFLPADDLERHVPRDRDRRRSPAQPSHSVLALDPHAAPSDLYTPIDWPVRTCASTRRSFGSIEPRFSTISKRPP